jgi:ribose transport system permease protein
LVKTPKGRVEGLETESEMSTQETKDGGAAAPVSSGGAGLSAKQVRISRMIQSIGMLPVLILLGIAFHFMTGERFFTAQNVSIVAQQASINTVLAAGMTFVILTGGIDLSVGSILAVSAMSGVIASLIPGLGLLGIPAALLTGLFFGFLNGSLVAFLDLSPFIVTLGSLTAVRGIARLMGGDLTVFNPDLPFAFIGNASLFGVIPVLAIIAFIVVGISWFVLRRTVLGVRIYAVGGNPAAARLSGIKVWMILLFVYCTSGLLAGLGGVMSVARLYAANGLQVGQSYELDAIASVVLGGTSLVGGVGTIWGTLIGALIIAVLSNGLILLGVSDIWQFIIKGLVIIGAVALDKFRSRGGART